MILTPTQITWPGTSLILRSAWVLLFISFYSFETPANKIYTCTKGTVAFTSNAPLEIIKATSEEMTGALDASNRTFLFSVDVNSFHGFNSGLQREHFNENYMETNRYPKVTFQGKLIEDINFEAEGNYEVRAKGILDVHGVKQERILKGTITIHHDVVTIHSQFSVLLEDHNIKVPRVVYEKIAPDIDITINAALKSL